MNNPDLYNRTVDILVGAYFDDTLDHGSCTACAVVNIIAANMGYIVRINKDSAFRIGFWYKKGNGESVNPAWHEVFITLDNEGHSIDKHAYKGEAKIQIDSTGYTWQELAQVERAFEKSPKGNSDDEWMFNGLMAVIEVLDKIHGNEDAAISQATKNRFNKVKNPIK